MVYNILSCAGFGDAVASSSFAGIGASGCIKARLALVFLFFILAIIRKWGGEEMGFEYSLLLSALGGIVIYIILISIFGSIKIAFPVALVVGVILGYMGGSFGLGGDGE